MLPWYSSSATGGNASTHSHLRPPSQIAVPRSSALQSQRNVGQATIEAGANRRAATGE